MITLDQIRRFAVARTLFPPTTLRRALHRMGFVQADPIRAPARAQDLILRHRVTHYHAGDLERRYPELGIEKDFFITYGFVTRELQALMHPRSETTVPADGVQPWRAARRRRVDALLAFVRERGPVHPREVDAYFSHGTVTNYWGGSSNATTHLLDAMHYRGLLRVARRDRGIRVYAVHAHGPAPLDPPARQARLDALVDAAVRLYAPLPGRSLAFVVRRLRYAAPQWRDDLTAALKRARQRLAHAQIDGVDGAAGPRRRRRGRAAAGAVRSRGARSRTLRAAVGMDLPVRGLHAGGQAGPRLLRAAAVVARPRDWLGQRGGQGRRARDRHRLYQRPGAARADVCARARGGAGTNALVPRPLSR